MRQVTKEERNRARSVVDIPMVKPEKISFNLPKSLFWNRLIAKAVTMGSLHNVPIEGVCENMGIGSEGLAGIFRR
ncbi:MAG: hypothetical protein ACP5VS_04745 [Desulfomonilaceae bacterium]